MPNSASDVYAVTIERERIGEEGKGAGWRAAIYDREGTKLVEISAERIAAVLARIGDEFRRRWPEEMVE